MSKRVRCAIYTRKSTEEGLDSDFSTLDAQREAGEAYILSQKHDGWVRVSKRYDDGGFTGANTDRPALTRLLEDIEAGKIDCVVVYKVDRLSRSLLDFSQIIKKLDDIGVTFVSVTEQFSTKTPVGRMTLNLMATFAQYERELISERTAHKVGAARRKGKWCGGQVPLGYEVDPEGGRILANDAEAETVRLIFETYLAKESLLDTARELNSWGIRTKLRTARDGSPRGGHEWDKTRLSYLLKSHIYAGKVFYKGTVYEGEHEAIVDKATWSKVQKLLIRNGRCGGKAARNKWGATLRGLLRCKACDSLMVHTYTQNHGRIYRYYSCAKAQKQGRNACTTGSLPAKEIENFVYERIRSIGTDRSLQEAVIAAARESSDKPLDERELAATLQQFEPLWDQLSPKDQTRVIQLLIEQVAYDSQNQTLAMTFRPTGIHTLTMEATL